MNTPSTKYSNQGARPGQDLASMSRVICALDRSATVTCSPLLAPLRVYQLYHLRKTRRRMIVGAWLCEGTRSLHRPMLRMHDLSHMYDIDCSAHLVGIPLLLRPSFLGKRSEAFRFLCCLANSSVFALVSRLVMVPSSKAFTVLFPLTFATLDTVSVSGDSGGFDGFSRAY
jgi:hypothetical protein